MCSVFFQIQKLWDWLLPLLSFVRNNITIETQDDWGTFFSTLSVSPAEVYAPCLGAQFSICDGTTWSLLNDEQPSIKLLLA